MKKNLLLCSMLFTSFVVSASEEFVKQKFNWTYSVQAKNASDMTDFMKFNDQMSCMINDINRGQNSNMYQQMLNFLKELQEAIVAGFNLFGMVTTSQAPVTEIVAQAAEAVVEEVLDQASQPEEANKGVQDASNASVVSNPVFYISLTCYISSEQEAELWKLATTMLQDLADNMNNNASSTDEIIASLTNVYDVLIQLQNSGLNLTAAINNQA